MYKILTALVILHDYRIIHRDLKLQNLVFEAPGFDESITIVDFGLAI